MAGRRSIRGSVRAVCRRGAVTVVVAACAVGATGIDPVPAGAVGGAGSWKEYTDIASVAGIVQGPDNAMWLTNSTVTSVSRVAANGSVTSFRSNDLYDNGQIVNGPNKTFWIVNGGATGSVSRMTTGGTVKRVTGFYYPSSVVSANGLIWVGSYGAITSLDPTAVTKVKAYTDAKIGIVRSMILGSDGAIWFTSSSGIGRLTFPGGVTTVETFTGSDVAQPYALTQAGGAVWWTNYGNNTIGRIALTGDHTTSSYPNGAGNIPLGASGITTGADGQLWYSAGTTVNRMNPTTHVVTKFAAAAPGRPACGAPGAVAPGPSSTIWYACSGRVLGHLSVTSGTPVTQVGLDTPASLVVGPDGNTWYVNGAGSIGKVTPLGAITNYYDDRIKTPDSIVVRGNALWFSDNNANAIGKITTAGVVTMYSLPVAPNYWGPVALTLGPDNKLWFSAGNIIAKWDPGTSVYTPYTNPAGTAIDLVASPTDNSLWFTNPTSSIGRITTGGTFSTPISDPSFVYPGEITVGPDGHSVWLTNAKWTTLGSIDTVTRAYTAHTNVNLSSGSAIATGPDGALWTNSHTVNGTVYRMTPAGATSAYTPSWPGTAIGTGDLVRGSDGAMWLRWGGYAALARVTTNVTPRVDTLTPKTGSAGATVTLTGLDLTGVTAVAFNGTAATFQAVDDTTIIATVPAGATTGRITVTTPIGKAWGPTFTVVT